MMLRNVIIPAITALTISFLACHSLFFFAMDLLSCLLSISLFSMYSSRVTVFLLSMSAAISSVYYYSIYLLLSFFPEMRSVFAAGFHSPSRVMYPRTTLSAGASRDYASWLKARTIAGLAGSTHTLYPLLRGIPAS